MQQASYPRFLQFDQVDTFPGGCSDREGTLF